MTNFDVIVYATEFAKETWGMDIDFPITVNSRLRSAKGRMIRMRKRKAGVTVTTVLKGVDYNPSLHDDDEDLKDTIRHELTHVYCFRAGLNFHDGDDDFEKELSRVGASSSALTGYASNIYQDAMKSGNITKNGVSDFKYEKADITKVAEQIAEGKTFGHRNLLNCYMHMPSYQLKNKEKAERVVNADFIKQAYHVSYRGEYLGIIFKIISGSYQWMALDGISVDGDEINTNVAVKTRKNIALLLLDTVKNTKASV